MTQAPSAPRGFGARLASDSFVYGLGGMANQAVAIVLVPIYARQLGTNGVGIAGVLNSTISLSLMFVGLALPQAFFRWYLREVSGEERAAWWGRWLPSQSLTLVPVLPPRSPVPRCRWAGRPPCS